LRIGYWQFSPSGFRLLIPGFPTPSFAAGSGLSAELICVKISSSAIMKKAVLKESKVLLEVRRTKEEIAALMETIFVST
jgi:hypothetical protein